MTAELRTAAEVRAHATIVQRRINERFRLARQESPAIVPHHEPEPEPEPRRLDEPEAPPLVVEPEPEAEPHWPILPPHVHRVRTVVKMTAEHFELSVREITSVYRHPRFARPRMVIYYVARHFMASFPLIGRLTKRDHTTVISGRKTIKERMAAGDDELKTAVNAIGARAAAAFGMEWLPVGDPPQQFEPESME